MCNVSMLSALDRNCLGFERAFNTHRQQVTVAIRVESNLRSTWLTSKKVDTAPDDNRSVDLVGHHEVQARLLRTDSPLVGFGTLRLESICYPSPILTNFQRGHCGSLQKSLSDKAVLQLDHAEPRYQAFIKQLDQCRKDVNLGYCLSLSICPIAIRHNQIPGSLQTLFHLIKKNFVEKIRLNKMVANALLNEENQSIDIN